MMSMFGHLVFEIFNFGIRPYQGKSNDEVIEYKLDYSNNYMI